jgi:hypothetical protein
MVSKQYKATDDWHLKLLMLKLITEISYNRAIVKKFQQSGCSMFIAADLIKCTQG